MSGLTDTAKNLTGSVGDKAQETVGGVTGQAGDVAGQAQNAAGEATSAAGSATGGKLPAADPSAPRSIPDSSASNIDMPQSNDEGEMVPAAGRVNEQGEVIDDDGNAIGKVSDEGLSADALKKLAGYIVTQEGDVLDDEGSVVGKAEPLEGVASELGNYTTGGKDQVQQQPVDDTSAAAKKAGGGGWGSSLGGFVNTGSQALGGVTGFLGKGAKDTTGAVGDTAKGATEQAGVGEVGDTVKGATDAAGNTVEGVTGTAGDAAQNVGETTGEVAEGAAQGEVPDVGETAEGLKDTSEGAVGGVQDTAEGAVGDVQEEGAAAPVGDLTEQLPVPIEEGLPELSPSVANKVVGLFQGPFTVADGGKVSDAEGKVLGRLAEGQDIQDLVGKEIHGIDGEGNMLGENDTVLGKVDIVPEGSVADKVREQVPEMAPRLDALEKAAAEAGVPDVPASIKVPSFAPSVADKVLAMFQGPFQISGEDGQVTDQNGKILGKLAEGQDFAELAGKDIKNIDAEGNLLGDNDTVLGKITLAPEGTVVDRIKDEVPEAGDRLDALEAKKAQAEEAAAEGVEGVEGAAEGAEEGVQLPDVSILEGLKINKAGNVVDDKGNPLGRVVSGDLKKLAGRMPDKEGKVWDDRGNQIGEVEVLPEAVENVGSAPFEDFPDATVDKFGKVIFDGRQVGVVVTEDGDFSKLIGKKVDADGDILDKHGNVIGRAERKEEEEPEAPEEEQIDYSMLTGKKVNKLGNVVDDKGQIWGRVIQGALKNLIGKKVGDNGEIFSDAGKVIGKAEPIPDSEREEAREPAPFEDFPDAVVADEGKVMFNGEQVGIVVEGDAKKLKGKTVDADGDILDRAGNQLGRAERWEAPEAEPEPEVDMSALAGKRINKAGNAVDKHGDIYGRVVEGSLARLVGKMCDKTGAIRNEGGDVIGRAELVPEAEREGMKEGPFSELPGCTVNKEGEVVTPGGDVVGRLVSGDPKQLFGRAVDDDGDILDKNGNTLGKAERWEKPVEEKEVNPMSGRKVNREGNVVDENGDLMGKLTSGELSQCAGKKIDDDGDVVDQKGTTLGHCSLLEDIPPTPEPEPEEPGETEEERQAREALERDRQLAIQMSRCIDQSLDKIKPLLKLIVDKIDAEERKDEEDRDEDQLVSDVRPLIEEAGKILTEANGVIRGLDPDGRIQAGAQARTATHEATAEEYHLADQIKELTGWVTETIEHAKRKLEDMPKAKKEINPLWGLLSEPLFQIIAAVGLLLSGVLGLVGKLLNGLGLGGLVNNLLGGLGLGKVLGGLGLGGDDGKKKKGKGGGGLLGLGIL